MHKNQSVLIESMARSNPVISMHEITHYFNNLADALLQQNYQISYNKFIILMAVFLQYPDPVSQKNVSHVSKLTEASVSRIVSELTNSKLLSKIVSKTNRSTSNLSLTKHGFETIENALKLIDFETRKQLEFLSKDEFAALNTLLTKLKKHIYVC